MPSKPKHKYDIAEIEAAITETLKPNWAAAGRKLGVKDTTLKAWVDRNCLIGCCSSVKRRSV